VKKCFNTDLDEFFISVTHTCDHFLTNLDICTKSVFSFWILAKHKSKITVEKMTRSINQQVLKMSIAHTQQVRHDTVPSSWLYIHVHIIFKFLFSLKYFLPCFLINTLFPYVILYPISIVLPYCLHSLWIRYELKHPFLLRHSKYLIRHEMTVKPYVLQHTIH